MKNVKNSWWRLSLLHRLLFNDMTKSERAEWNTVWLWSRRSLTSTIDFLMPPKYLSLQWSGFSNALWLVQPSLPKGHRNKACIHSQSRVVPMWQHKWLSFALACNVAVSEETRECLLWACNYGFCLLLRTASNYPSETRKSPNEKRKRSRLNLNLHQRPVITAFKYISCPQNSLSCKQKLLSTLSLIFKVELFCIWSIMLNKVSLIELKDNLDG